MLRSVLRKRTGGSRKKGRVKKIIKHTIGGGQQKATFEKRNGQNGLDFGAAVRAGGETPKNTPHLREKTIRKRNARGESRRHDEKVQSHEGQKHRERRPR